MRSITFKDYVPSARSTEPWTQVRIEEAATKTGPWSQIDLIDLSPLDADPLAPAPRTFTTDLASDFASWFLVTFLDASGDESPTKPVLAQGTDPQDVRTLIPRVRRMVQGPGPDDTSLTDSLLGGLIADAAAEIILLTNGTFGLTLESVGRDVTYGAANSWRFSLVPTDNQETIIAVQAALGLLYRRISETKVSEEIKDEGSSWSYTTSASVLRDWLKSLQTIRDSAMQILDQQGVALDTVFSFIEVRDSEASTVVESWV